MARHTPALALLGLLLLPGGAQAKSLALEVRGHRIDFSPFTLLALPGEALRIGLPGNEADSLQFSLDGTPAGHGRENELLLNAPPEPGQYTLQVDDPETGAQTILNLMVTVPAERVENDRLQGYRIGPPPPGHARHPELYRAPAGFIEVTPGNLNTRLTPHITLRQLLCKQAGGYPKYVVIRESLLVLLEGLLQAVRDAGYPAATFGVISGYRTPWYNKLIGNVPNSRHVYGDAMDLFIDVDGDGNMDDLDGDGDHDREDVTRLYNIAREFMQRPENAALIGGIVRYGKTSRHGGFVHVDTRGYKARW